MPPFSFRPQFDRQDIFEKGFKAYRLAANEKLRAN